MPVMFIEPVRSINEKEFCEEYRKKNKAFKKSLDYASAVEMLRLNSEEYMALEVLKSSLTAENYLQQLLLTTEILETNQRSYCTWMHRMHLMKRVDLASDISKIHVEDIWFIHKVLRADCRNMHAWVHIAVVYRYSNRIIEDELSRSISNFSAYHAAIENSTYKSINSTEIKNIVFTDPKISSPWVFIRIIETVRRFNGKNAFLKKYSDRISFYLKTAGKTKVYVKCKGKTVEYSAEYKKSFSLYFKQEKYAFAEIESIKLKTKGKETLEINMEQALPIEPPDFLDDILQQCPTIEAYITQLYFTAEDALKREKIVKTLVELDPGKEQMYLDLKEAYAVYSAK